MAVELCISDKNKPLLLANSAFIPYVVDALLLVVPSSHTSQQGPRPPQTALGLSPSSDDFGAPPFTRL